ncbi:MAG TPA: glycosyltransferase [Candidatus Paceibacterota bacterium]|nr:glycosyltransferase [Candidatus Paceibacterota bacterium]
MRIAICTDQYLPLLSGVSDSIDTLKGELEKHGHTVRIYAPATTGSVPDPDVKRLHQIPIPGSGEALVFVFPFGMLDDLRAFKPDIIHSHSTGIIGWRGALAARKLGVPLVGTSHTLPVSYLHYFKSDHALGKWLVRNYTAAYFGRCSIISAPSKAMIDELNAYGLHADTRVISNPIRTDQFYPLQEKPALKKKWGVRERAVLLFGRIAKEKNIDDGLAVFAEITHTSDDVQLVVVGDGPYRALFERNARERGLADRVKNMGLRRGDELNEILNACDVFIITSESETQSMTTLQAMACGLPIVAARAGALPEYVHDGGNGYIREPHDTKGFANRILQVLDNPALAHELGEEGRETALKFSPEKIVTRFEEMYKDALRK